MSDRFFVDTNILVYAHDRGSGEKHSIAGELVRRLWRDRSGTLSTQVIHEFYVNVRRKAGKPIGAPAAKRLIEDYLSWNIVVNDGASVLRAIDFEQRYRISFWDALIVQAANASNATLLLSEDFSHGQLYGSVEARNPFVAPL
jgi:predicted nucleic acid-binding protein